MKFQLFVPLMIAIAAPMAFADDGAVPPSKPSVISGPTAEEFLPLTRSERLRNYLLGIGGPESVVRAAFSAGIRQAENSPKEWGGGVEAYGYRIGDAFAQRVIRGTLQYGASTILHEDNRYFVSGQTGTWRRAKYAITSTFLARRDNGDRTFSYSHLGAAAGTAFISRIWQPRSTTSAGDGAVSFGIAMASDVGFNVFREFFPDLKRHFRKAKR